MAKLTYSEQLRHPNWQRKRLEVLNAAHWACTNCGDKEITLNVHHKIYIKGQMAWEYPNEQLAVLCEPCHRAEHADRAVLDWILAEAPSIFLGEVIGLVAGYLDSMSLIEEGYSYCLYQTSQQAFDLGVAAALLGPEQCRSLVREIASSRSHKPAVDNTIARWDRDGPA